MFPCHIANKIPITLNQTFIIMMVAMSQFVRRSLVALGLFYFCGTAQAQSVPAAAIVYGNPGVYYRDETADMIDACTRSLESAVQKCISAGGTPESLTSVVPAVKRHTIDKTPDANIIVDRAVVFTCEWNVSCLFPSRKALADLSPYIR